MSELKPHIFCHEVVEGEETEESEQFNPLNSSGQLDLTGMTTSIIAWNILLQRRRREKKRKKKRAFQINRNASTRQVCFIVPPIVL
jgi:hypothetical protein